MPTSDKPGVTEMREILVDLFRKKLMGETIAKEEISSLLRRIADAIDKVEDWEDLEPLSKQAEGLLK